VDEGRLLTTIVCSVFTACSEYKALNQRESFGAMKKGHRNELSCAIDAGYPVIANSINTRIYISKTCKKVSCIIHVLPPWPKKILLFCSELRGV
jgi:hypothetical protein